MPNNDENLQIFPDRESLADGGAHRNEHGHLSFTETGQLESILLDSDIFSEDCSKEVRLILKGDVDLSSVAKSKNAFRLIRASTLNSPFAPGFGFRVDGDYRNTFRDWQILAEDDRLIRGIILERVTQTELPIREPFRQIIELVTRFNLEWRVVFIGGVAEVLVFTLYGIVLHIRFEPKRTVETYLHFRSWSLAEGDRTDWHEVLPLTLALFLRREYGISCALYDQLNPAIGLEAEIYARYIIFEQASDTNSTSDSNVVDKFARLLTSVVFSA
jgi:hypothetical protein